MKPDKSKSEAITNFPKPKDITGIRSFLGLVNQLNHFVPNLSSLSDPLKQLLKKNTSFTWLPEHDKAFSDVKNALTSKISLQHFNHEKTTYLITDASKLHGLGFILIQSDKGPDQPEAVIQCGSRGLTNFERNYAIIELECLAISWAISKCGFFLKGCPNFKIITDHRPLVGIFAKPLGDIQNPRLVRIREKTMAYSFDVVWIKGKNNAMADAFSRNLVNQPETTKYAIKSYIIGNDTLIKEIKDAANECITYKQIATALIEDKEPKNFPNGHSTKLLQDVWHQLSITDDNLVVLDNSRILIPKSCRNKIIQLLHKPHAGISKTLATAKKYYYWPKMRYDLTNAIDKCEECQIHRPKQNNDIPIETKASEPMEKLSLDLFEIKGKHFLIVVDRFSGLPWIKPITSLATNSITKRLNSICREFGYPRSVRTDGGPQFRGEFKSFCNKYGIIHEVSSPYNHPSNGQAEVNIRMARQLIMKTSASEFEEAFSEWKNTERNDKPSPNKLFFKQNLHLQPPTLDRNQPLTPDLNPACRKDKLRPLAIGSRIRTLDKEGKWTWKGTITKINHLLWTYQIILDDGRKFIRNRKFLKQCYV